MSTSSAPRRRSITETHARIAQLGWEPDYHQPAIRYPTRYRFPHKAKDPMKHIMPEYLPMELEKDERVYGGFDAAVRADMPSKAHERWLEILKPFITITNFAEIGAGRCMSMLMSAVPNNELRNGYHVQFVDEIRHTGMQMALARWYAKNVPDPAGWNLGPKGFTNSVLTNPGLNMLSHFIVGDPIQCAFTLQVVAETAFTNVVFVALPDVAARNGDFTLPTTYLSVQSDAARHISNGYATLLTVLQADHNAPLIERELQQAWWINHAFLDVFAGAAMEYFSPDRSDAGSVLGRGDGWIRAGSVTRRRSAGPARWRASSTRTSATALSATGRASTAPRNAGGWTSPTSRATPATATGSTATTAGSSRTSSATSTSCARTAAR